MKSTCLFKQSKLKEIKKEKLNTVYAYLRVEVDLPLAFQMLTFAKLWFEL